MKMDCHGNMIGRGEETTSAICQVLFPLGIFHQQAKLVLFTKAFNYPEPLSERQKKETIDLVIRRSISSTEYIAVRVQDSRHRGTVLARADRHQKDILQHMGILVVDLHENECPELFKERFNYLSFLEVCQQFKAAGIKS